MDMPLFGTRRFDLHTKRTGGPMGSNKRISNEELVISEIGQVGTQFDMFSHQGIDGLLYNCFKTDEIATRNGFTKLGVEKIGMLFTRGVLVDVAALKGVDILPSGYEITVADLQAALARQGLSLQPGDAVLIHTGYGKLWGVDNAKIQPRYARHRRAGRRVAGQAGRHADRRRHFRRGSRAQSRTRISACRCTRSRWRSTASSCSRT